jgi:hypothetical protein
MRLGLETVGSVRVRRERQIATVGRRAGTGGKRAYSGRLGKDRSPGETRRCEREKGSAARKTQSSEPRRPSQRPGGSALAPGGGGRRDIGARPKSRCRRAREPTKEKIRWLGAVALRMRLSVERLLSALAGVIRE